MTRRNLAPLAAAIVVLAAVGGPAPVAAVDLVAAEGDLLPFGPSSAPVAGMEVHVVEQPSLTATTDADGHWRIDGLEVGSTATFAIDDPSRPPIQTATFTVPDGGLDRVAFQSPDHQMVAALEGVVGVASRPDRCHIASTVTRRGYSLYGGAADGTHGEPGATVEISPTPAEVDGPIYFNGSSFDVIWPDRALRETTVDGGVLFVNVAPGTYTLTAQKAGAAIAPVTVTCRPGWLANAAPPWGLQVTAGGLDLDETRPFPGPTPEAPVAPTTTVP
ncbi:MAG: carboxypeptidase regulatory-like domain-containing protein, partial [Acidimicrobiales bacterium]|nr:carboxypeptidase regulatory-like domain-containing protein [Acidimicrobiales bacterium]